MAYVQKMNLWPSLRDPMLKQCAKNAHCKYMNEKNELIIYRSKSGEVEIETRLENETLWLSQEQMAGLFDVNRQAISKHLINIFKTKELKVNSVCSILEHTAEDNKSYKVKFYNLDAVISVGYRVNSKKATDFRVWATKTLRQYLTKGYVINSNKFTEIQKIVRFITSKAKQKELEGHEKEILDVISKYSSTWKILGQFDEDKIEIKRTKQTKWKLNHYYCRDMIDTLKEELISKKLAGKLFGRERDHSLEGIVGNLYQTFGGKELYNSIEEKAAHLLYFVIKDHPFSDGNKRIGSLLFLDFLYKNNFLLKEEGIIKISNKTIVALALLVAASDPKEKDSIIKLIINIIQD